MRAPQDLSAAMNSHRAGDVVTVTVFRGKKRMDIKVTLGDAKDEQPTGQQTVKPETQLGITGRLSVVPTRTVFGSAMLLALAICGYLLAFP